MKKLKIALLSTALLIGVSHASYAEYTQKDLDTLRELSESKDKKALIAFIRANPQLLVGENPLAGSLREFVKAQNGFLGGLFAARAPNLKNVPDLPEDAQTSSQVDFGSLGDFGS